MNLEKIEEVLEPVAHSVGCELVACEWLVEKGQNILRVLIDKAEGVSVGDCESFSYLINPLLDVEDFIVQRYQLEVSSPGLERPLKKIRDFERFAGHTIRLRTKTPVESRGHFKGLLKGIEENHVLIECEAVLYRIPYPEIKRAHLEIDWAQEMKKRKK